MKPLANLRRDLAQARDTLKTAKSDLETTKTIATMNVTGKNDDERKRAKDQALLDDHNYNKARMHFYACEYAVECLETEIEIAKDERTARELACRERNNEVLDKYADALERLARQNPITTAIDAALPL